MEKRQLNFNAPLLSARRYSSPSRSTEFVVRKPTEKPMPDRQQSLPVNNLEWMNEEVTKPASVPFQWEQIPGRPKDEVESQAPSPEERPSNTPGLPPSMVSDAIRRNSGECPRLPPGRLSGPLRYNSGERLNDHDIYQSLVDSFSYKDHAMLLQKLNESLSCKDESYSESVDDAYSDAVDTLSLKESQSLKYSVSGLSGYQSSGVRPSGTFCVDEQTRDFMMNRFLPAAKAAVIETPQYVTKKSLALNEPPKYVRKAVSGEIKPLHKVYTSVVLPYHDQYRDESASEDDNRESRIPVKKPGKVWGILPKFCVKRSLCLLNPLPVMKSRTRLPAPPTPPSIVETRRLTRKALSGPLDKNGCHVPKARFHSGLLSGDMRGIEDKLNSDYNEFLNSRNSFKSQLSPLRRYRSGNVSPYRNESPKPQFREGVGFLGTPKEADKQIANKIASSRKLLKALQDVSRNQNNEKGCPGARDDAVEKTLYVEFVNKSGPLISTGEGMKVFADRQQIENINAGKCNQELSDVKRKPSSKARTTHKAPPAACTRELGYMVDAWAGLESDQTLIDMKLRKSEPCNGKETDHPLKSPMPPPLPKSPSESWLWRTLPSISLGNPFAHARQRSHLHQKKQGDQKDTKWETIVKTANLQHDHALYSEELTPHALRGQRKS